MDPAFKEEMDAYDERIRAIDEQFCREIIAQDTKALEVCRRELEVIVANPEKMWRVRAWMERRFEADLVRWSIYYYQTRIEKALVALSETELSKT